MRFRALAPWLLAFWSLPLRAQQSQVAGTLHNLSISGPGEVRSLTETEICKFCHIPHNTVLKTALWGHNLSQVTQYAVPDVRTRGKGFTAGFQPDGASRLCLSCHDGTVALGDIGVGRQLAPMQGATYLGPGRKGYIGTDLTGSHPISMPVEATELDPADRERDMVVRPLALIQQDREVRLDQAGKMQCTTCHDPHRDTYYTTSGRVPHFWVKPSVAEVCLVCHELR